MGISYENREADEVNRCVVSDSMAQLNVLGSVSRNPLMKGVCCLRLRWMMKVLGRQGSSPGKGLAIHRRMKLLCKTQNTFKEEIKKRTARPLQM